jgi:hypothetical protein
MKKIILFFVFTVLLSTTYANSIIEKPKSGIDEIENIIIRGRLKKKGNIGDDHVVDCIGRRGTCMIVFTDDSRIVTYNPDTETPDETYYGTISLTNSYINENGEPVDVYIIEEN